MHFVPEPGTAVIPVAATISGSLPGLARAIQPHPNRGYELTVERLGFLRELLFDSHIFELTGFEDFATLQALDEIGVFFAGYNLHARMAARLIRERTGSRT